MFFQSACGNTPARALRVAAGCRHQGLVELRESFERLGGNRADRRAFQERPSRNSWSPRAYTRRSTVHQIRLVRATIPRRTPRSSRMRTCSTVLRHHAVVRRDHEERHPDSRYTRDHVADEPLVPRHVHYSHEQDRPRGSTARTPGQSSCRVPARPSAGRAAPCQHRHKARLPVVHMPCGADHHHHVETWLVGARRVGVESPQHILADGLIEHHRGEPAKPIPIHAARQSPPGSDPSSPHPQLYAQAGLAPLRHAQSDCEQLLHASVERSRLVGLLEKLKEALEVAGTALAPADPAGGAGPPIAPAWTPPPRHSKMPPLPPDLRRSRPPCLTSPYSLSLRVSRHVSKRVLLTVPSVIPTDGVILACGSHRVRLRRKQARRPSAKQVLQSLVADHSVPAGRSLLASVTRPMRDEAACPARAQFLDQRLGTLRRSAIRKAAGSLGVEQDTDRAPAPAVSAVRPVRAPHPCRAIFMFFSTAPPNTPRAGNPPRRENRHSRQRHLAQTPAPTRHLDQWPASPKPVTSVQHARHRQPSVPAHRDGGFHRAPQSLFHSDASRPICAANDSIPVPMGLVDTRASPARARCAPPRLRFKQTRDRKSALDLLGR